MGLKCPSCGSDNIQGIDRCEQCFHSMMNADLPKPQKNDSIQSTMMKEPIANLLTGEDLLVASPSDTMDKIIKLFQRENKTCILVYKSKKLIGILSRRDVLRRVASSEANLSSIKLEAVMTPNPEYVKAEDPVAFVVNKMALGGFRHVPVLAADGTPISIVTIQDVLSHLSTVV